MEFARGVETEPFAWCIRQGRQRLFAARPWGHHREFSYVERGFYGEQVDRLLRIFPRDQLLILQAEALRTDPTRVLAELRAFLALPARSAQVEPREVHVGRDVDHDLHLAPADAAYLREIYARDRARLAELVGAVAA
jgi:hypothetical protein